jgi:hypothetical protein
VSSPSGACADCRRPSSPTLGACGCGDGA